VVNGPVTVNGGTATVPALGVINGSVGVNSGALGGRAASAARSASAAVVRSIWSMGSLVGRLRLAV
jgi:hypothetical protein